MTLWTAAYSLMLPLCFSLSVVFLSLCESRNLSSSNGPEDRDRLEVPWEALGEGSVGGLEQMTKSLQSHVDTRET